jgi:hypothetical protein
MLIWREGFASHRIRAHAFGVAREDRQSAVSLPSARGYGLLFRRVSDNSVYTGSPFALVGGHSFNGQTSGAERVGEQTL